MEALIGFSALAFALWLTLLTKKVRDQKAQINELRRNNKIYLRELINLGYVKEERTKEAEADQTGNDSGH